MQAQLNNLLGLHRTNSRVSIDSISTFAGSIKTKKAFKKFCQNLYQIGVRADMIKEKESKILDIFKAQNTDVNSQIDVSNIAGQSTQNAVTSDSDQSTPQNTATSGQVDGSNIVNLAVSTFLIFYLYLLIGIY